MNNKIFPVVINAGGLGKRLSSAYGGLPKALVPVFEKPIIIDQINKFHAQGIDDFYILLGYKSEYIQKTLELEFDKTEICLSFFTEKEPLGSGGSILNFLEYLPNKFIFTYCDIYFDLNVQSIIDFHQTNNALMTILVHPNDHPFDSDLVLVNSGGWLSGIKAHPHSANDFSGNLVNAAFYVIEKSCLQSVSWDGQKLDFAQDILPEVIQEGRVISYQTPEFIKDMGTPARLEKVRGNYKKRYSVTGNKVICLDRDGTINKCRMGDYITVADDFELIDGAAEAIKIFRDLGYFVLCITNQPVVARGDVNIHALKKIHDRMDWLLATENAYLDKVFYCPHHPDKGFKGEVANLKFDCKCRKPETGLLDLAMDYIPFSVSESWFVGDSWRDVQCGKSYGMQTCTIGIAKNGADLASHNLLEFANCLKTEEEK